MAFIGNQPILQAFLTDQFSGNGSTTAFTMSVAPANTASVLVAVTGVVQDPSTYSVVGTTLTFSAAPPTGTGNISVRYLGIPASGVTTTAYRTVTEYTASAGQQTFTVPSYTVGFINVYLNGVRLGSADYTAANGTTVVLAAGAVAGALVTTESFYVSSVLNAVPNTGGTIAGSLVVTGNTSLGDDATDTLNVGNGGLVKDSSGNVGIGTASPNQRLHVKSINGQIQTEATSGNPSFKLTSATNNRDWEIFSWAAVSGQFGIYDGVAGQNRLLIDTSGNLQFNSGYGSVATAYGCRAWVNFNGTLSGTISPRGSGNVTSVTKNGTGDYTVNITTAMPDANYAVCYGTGGNSAGQYPIAGSKDAALGGTAQTTTAFRMFSVNLGASPVDTAFLYAAVFRQDQTWLTFYGFNQTKHQH